MCPRCILNVRWYLRSPPLAWWENSRARNSLSQFADASSARGLSCVNNEHGQAATRCLLGLPLLLNRKSVGLSLSWCFPLKNEQVQSWGGMAGGSAPRNRGEPGRARLPTHRRWGPRNHKVHAGPEAAARLLPITPALCALGRPHVPAPGRAGPEARASRIPFPPRGTDFATDLGSCVCLFLSSHCETETVLT